MSRPAIITANSISRAPSSTEDLKDTTETLSPPKLSFYNRLDALWILELSAIVASVACFVAIIVILSIFDDTSVPDWTFFFSLNAIVSTLGTTSNALMGLAVSAALGQAKWNWFGKHRSGPLANFSMIDRASRGPLGSLQCLFYMRSRYALVSSTQSAPYKSF